ncbi:Sjogren's syndrome/scleroderma autoantigen 1 family protein [Thermosphaera sp.]|uniref:Sjogrens syndrome scleroderma autoantigen 1 n=1 Tax=Thermosphaera aggregans TaxID=54254 RepID=A0A7C2FE58_9CREN
MGERKDYTKIMAEYLKAGATMLSLACPVEGCGLPLFKLRTGEIVCAVHGRVHLVKSDEEVKEIKERITLVGVLDKLEEKTLNIIREQSESEDVDPREIIGWLEVLERIRRLKEMSRERQSSPKPS